jgi:ATP adenylyltransferase
MDRIWSPWRHAYVTRSEEPVGCVFCIARTTGDGQQLIVHDGALAYVILNKFPYNAGLPASKTPSWARWRS